MYTGGANERLSSDFDLRRVSSTPTRMRRRTPLAIEARELLVGTLWWPLASSHDGPDRDSRDEYHGEK